MTGTPFLERARLLRTIHAARRALGLEESDYRGLLAGHTGKASAAELSLDELKAVILLLRGLGFEAKPGLPPGAKPSARPGIRLIFGLWSELGRKGLIDSPGRPALFAFVRRMTGLDHPDWLDNAQANKVIEALKAIKARGRQQPEPGDAG